MEVEMNLLKDIKLVNVLQGYEVVTFGIEICKLTLFSQCLFSKQVEWKNQRKS